MQSPAIAIERRAQTARRASHPMAHHTATLAFYARGRARVQLAGEWELTDGDVLLVPAGARHHLLDAHAPEMWRVELSVPSLAPTLAAALLEPLERVREGGSAVARLPPARQGHVERLLSELARVVGRRPGPDAVAESVERSLLVLVLAELAEATRTVPATGAGGVVARALRVIERRCLGPLGLAEVARAVDRSPAHVTTALRRATGRSAVQWITLARMTEARRLLLHSDARVEELATRVGYADPTHFIRTFRREHGVTPAAWRARALSASRR